MMNNSSDFIRLALDADDFAQIERALVQIPHRIDPSIASATNTAATAIKKLIKGKIAEEYTLSKAEIDAGNKSIKTKKANATKNSIYTQLLIRGRLKRLAYFDVEPAISESNIHTQRHSIKNYKAHVLQSSAYKNLTGNGSGKAFAMKTKSAVILVARLSKTPLGVRNGKRTYSYFTYSGPSYAAMFGTQYRKNENEAQRILKEKVSKAIQNQLKKYGGEQ